MKCNIICDLIPLYIDGCCSDESAEAVKEHLSQCADCRVLYEDMKNETASPVIYTPSKEIHRIDMWKASVLQSALFFVSFALITLGVAFEANIPSGFLNGYSASALVVPVTGFMLSLANWYFIRLYKSRKSFSAFSALLTFTLIVCGDIFALLHYELNLFDFFKNSSSDILEALFSPVLPFMPNIILTAALCCISKLLSDRYAKLLGKE